jgi:hypothetical protein
MLSLLHIADDPITWRSMGFALINNNEVHLNGVIIKLLGKSARTRKYGMESWGFTVPSNSVIPTNLLGIPTTTTTTAPNKTPPSTQQPHHPNSAFAIDHVVLYVKDEITLKQQFASLPGFDIRGERILGSPPSNTSTTMKQIFFRPGGGTIIECLVGLPDVENNELWGLTIAVQNIEPAKQILGNENASNIRDAIQKGRKILTIRHEKLNSLTNIALMTPHVKKSTL